MLNKTVCEMCWKYNWKINWIIWERMFNVQWNYGKIFCPLKYSKLIVFRAGGFRDIKNKPPLYCCFKMEHIIMGKK